MSDYKSNANQTPNPEEMQALFDLLGRLEKRDDLQRQQDAANAFSDLEPIDLIAAEEEEEELHAVPARFQPMGWSDADVHSLLLIPGDDFDGEEADEGGEESLPLPPRVRRNPFKVLWSGFCGNLPHKGDSVGTKVRKYGFLTSLLVMVLAVVYLAVDLLLLPAQNTKLKNELIEIYHPEYSQVVLPADAGDYPENMLASFKDLYDRNNEVRGWISFHAYGKKDFLDIEYPIVYSGDNEKYLKKDFDGNKNRNGTLFFDKANKLNSAEDTNRSLIVYGHNMASGQMFAGLNKFLGSVNNARIATTLTMSTLYRQDQYKVFAVILTDESDTVEGRYFNTRRTGFLNDTDFLQYIDEMRAHSIFDYPVDVQGNDQILVLSTCTGKTSAHVKDGRLVVVARRLREGEEAVVNTANIVKNEDVIMPYYWYINQKLTPHQYYTDAGLDYPSVPQEPDGSTIHTGRTETTTTTEGVTGGSVTSGTAGDDTTAAQKPSTGTATGTKPTAGTTAATKPTDSTTPTGGTTTPTAPTDPTDPTVSTDPTESTDPTASGDPTEPTDPTESTGPSGDPTDPTDPTEPTEPSVEPTEPTEPSVEPKEPTEPSVEPTEPTEPTTEPTEPTEE